MSGRNTPTSHCYYMSVMPVCQALGMDGDESIEECVVAAAHRGGGHRRRVFLVYFDGDLM